MIETPSAATQTLTVKRPHRYRLPAFAWALLAFAVICSGTVWADSLKGAGALDSPYVLQDAKGALQAWSVEDAPTGATKRVRQLKTGDKIDIPAVGRVPSFRVTLRPPATIEPDERVTAPDTSLFVVADTHGEYEILVELLQKQHIVDKALRWSFGRGHLIFLGDVFDRGPNQTEILWLIYQLETEALKAGGGVHFILGNHEMMVLSDDLRYTNPKYARIAEVLGVESYSQLFAPSTVLGQWLRTKPAVFKINDLLCLHGGISRDVVKRMLTLQSINSSVRDVLNGKKPATPQIQEQNTFVMSRLGPLWYRGYFAEQTDFPTATATDVENVLKYFGVNRILVGHTIVPTITPLFDGNVVAVQVYPHLDKNSGHAVMEALRIERVKSTRLLRAKINGNTELLD